MFTSFLVNASLHGLTETTQKFWGDSAGVGALFSSYEIPPELVAACDTKLLAESSRTKDSGILFWKLMLSEFHEEECMAIVEVLTVSAMFQ